MQASRFTGNLQAEHMTRQRREDFEAINNEPAFDISMFIESHTLDNSRRVHPSVPRTRWRTVHLNPTTGEFFSALRRISSADLCA
jgi:hypothetical protein